MFVVSMQLFANHTTFVETAMRADGVRKPGLTTMFASAAGGEKCFPVGATVGLIGMAKALLGNWHDD